MNFSKTFLKVSKAHFWVFSLFCLKIVFRVFEYLSIKVILTSFMFEFFMEGTKSLRARAGLSSTLFSFLGVPS